MILVTNTLVLADTGRLSTYLGLPPPLCMPQQARAIRRSQHLASSILTRADHATIKILDVLCCANTHLDAVEDNASQFSMTQMFEVQLDTISTEFRDDWSEALNAQMLAAKIYILGIPLTQDLPVEKDKLPRALLYRQLILEKAMKASAQLISTMVNLSNQSTPGHRYASGILTFYPKHYFASLVAATAFLFRFILGCQGATQAQQEEVIGYIAEAHKIMQSFPDHRDAVRGTINIETFVNVIRNNTGGNNTDLLVKNRLGASVVHDALFRAAQYRNRRPVDGSSPPVSQWVPLDEGNSHRLPLAPEQKVVSPKEHLWQESNMMSEGAQPQAIPSWVGVWDNYFNEFGVLTEPWIQNDDEFAMAGLQAQAMFPPMPNAYGYPQPTGPAMGN